MATHAVFLGGGVLALGWIGWTVRTAPGRVQTLKPISLYCYFMVLLWVYLLLIFWGQL